MGIRRAALPFDRLMVPSQVEGIWTVLISLGENEFFRILLIPPSLGSLPPMDTRRPPSPTLSFPPSFRSAHLSVPAACTRRPFPASASWSARQAHHTGYLVAVKATSPLARTKALAEVVDAEPLLDPQLLALTKWIADYYLCPGAR